MTITPTNTTSPEWCNENELRDYPIREDAGTTVPANVIADLHVTVSSGIRPAAVYVSSVYVSEYLVSVAVSAIIGGKKIGIAAKTVTRDEMTPGSAYSMDSLLRGSAGYVSFGEITDAEIGKYVMDENTGRLEESAVTNVRPSGVTSIVDETHDTTSGGVVSIDGGGVFRTYLSESDECTVIVELAEGMQGKVTSECGNAPSFDTCGMTPVTSINGVKPDENGTITLRFK